MAFTSIYNYLKIQSEGYVQAFTIILKSKTKSIYKHL
jgi:hypothetical protein